MALTARASTGDGENALKGITSTLLVLCPGVRSLILRLR